MKTLRLIFGILLLFSVPAAQSADTEWYAIDVIVFENTGPDTSDGELWTSEPLDTDMADAILPENRPDESSPMTVLVRRLEAAPAYKVLYHNRWLQEAAANSATQPARITDAAPPGSPYPASGTDHLDGFVRLRRARFLQVEADLAFQPAAPEPLAPPYQNDVYSTGTVPQPTYVLHEKRRVKFDEIHYLDHPKFGILVMVSKAEPPTQP